MFVKKKESVEIRKKYISLVWES